MVRQPEQTHVWPIMTRTTSTSFIFTAYSKFNLDSLHTLQLCVPLSLAYDTDRSGNAMCWSRVMLTPNKTQIRGVQCKVVSGWLECSRA